MKKTYIKPQMVQELLAVESMICDSITAKTIRLNGSEAGFQKAAKDRYDDEDEDFFDDIWK